ncbi:DUF5103 domain-containing protein [Sanyastnella coralliicola]|uniref:type IX secretion system plug protein n=1 Tax=Sanyastnella coralliicola TaxID=3069118 RepID=UPI0027B9829E|nr:DUF5103 domain-containing protein [Longitalea sp. SCSIO 12813]
MNNLSFSHILLTISTLVVSISCTVSDSSVSHTAPIVTETDSEYFHDYRNIDRIYEPYIRTVLLHPVDNPLLAPIIDLNSPAQLELRFDDLHGGFKDYWISVTHCDYEWNDSDLLASEYIQGFQELMINDIEQSFNTVQNYTNYAINWPNDMSKPMLSGNYILKVYEEGYEEEPVFTRRIVVTEQLSRFRPQVKASTIVADRRYRQEVDFDLIEAEYKLYDPYSDLEVAILQNHRWDNAITGLKPVFMKGTELVYDFDEENNFDGLNEFRWFDSKSLRYAAVGTDSIREIKGEWHYYLQPDLRRTYEVYRTDRDINGEFLIRNDDFDDHLESQYIYTHFYLPFDEQLYQQEVYIIGGFNQWDHFEENRMTWNPRKKRYECTLYLKQGYYNYMYSIVSADHPNGTQAFIEGNHQMTENEYTILAYYSDPAGYDRVIGVLTTDSFNGQ